MGRARPRARPMARPSLARSTLLLFVVVAGGLALPWIIEALAKKKLDDGAREEFTRIYSCPGDRVEVRPRPDLTAWDLEVAKSGRGAPPDDIARDPERLAIWTKSEREQQERVNEDTGVFEVRGCGTEVLWACDHPTVAGGEVYIGMVSCEPGVYPPGTRRSW